MSNIKRKVKTGKRGKEYDSLLQIRSREKIGQTNESFISEIEAGAKAYLKSLGYPSEYPKFYPMPDGGQGTILAILESENKHLEPEGHAAKILHYAHRLRLAIQDQDISNIIHTSMLFQQSIDHFHFSRYEPLIIRGMDDLKTKQDAQKESTEQKKYSDKQLERKKRNESMREWHKLNYSYEAIASHFGVSKTTVSNIINGKK
jgi:hypothetical protein